jgi:hypothetical protein
VAEFLHTATTRQLERLVRLQPRVLTKCTLKRTKLSARAH